MTTTTDLITYNVRERGRKARGQDRNFDTSALAKLINGADVQEKVKHGDMVGYFGHWPRIKLGMEPAEGGIVDGKVVAVSPALRTVELRADADGTIRHRAEFLDTNEGLIAARLYHSKTGGFSSAITPLPGTNPVLPAGFHGFDYVLEPNYTTNRGHKVMLDGVEVPASERDELLAMLDSAVGESVMAAATINRLFDSLYEQHKLALETLERLAQENDLLVGRLASGQQGSVLDGVGERPLMAMKAPDYERYLGMELAPLQRLPESRGGDASGRALDAVIRRMGLEGF